MTMKLIIIMKSMTTTLPVVAHQLVSDSVLESLRKRLGLEM